MTMPTMPPQLWMPTTSRVSSTPSRYFQLIANAQLSPARKPMTVAHTGLTPPASGVMATRPVTAPMHMSSRPTCRVRHQLVTAQPAIAAPTAS